MVLDKIRSAFKKERPELKIQASLASANMVLFSLSEIVLTGDKCLCQDSDTAKGSPLLEKLFSNTDVVEVFVNEDSMRVKFKEEADLKSSAGAVGKEIRELWTSGTEFFPQEFISKNNAPKEADVFVSESAQGDLGKQIRKILEDTVAPSLAAHGGHVTLVDLKDDFIHLNFGGGCQGCSQVASTVKDGVEKILLENFPQFKGVMDVTNHSTGENPYYR
jgi:Fe-S cluster biogenesis protein NfuA